MSDDNVSIIKHITVQETPVYQDSIEIGTPGKGGVVKIYFDAGSPADAEQRIRTALLLREMTREIVDTGSSDRSFQEEDHPAPSPLANKIAPGVSS